VVLTGGALMFRESGTPAVVVALGIASFTYGALLGGFFLGLFVHRARQRDALTGMSVAIVVMALIVFARQFIAVVPSLAGPLGPLTGIAWPWYVLIGTVITVGVGSLSSLFGPPRVVGAGPEAARPERVP
jgi:Na+/proline symporter